MLNDCRHRLARLRSAVPAPSSLDLATQQLYAAATRFFTDRGSHLEVIGRDLTSTRRRCLAPDEITQLAGRLVPAATRARRGTNDFARAFTRLRQQADRSFARRLGEHDRNLVDTRRDLANATNRRATAAGRMVDHVVELIAAKDFRRSGWVLAGDAGGHPLRSARARRDMPCRCISMMATQALPLPRLISKEESMSDAPTAGTEITFEDGYDELKRIVARLDAEDVSVHVMCELFARGKGLEKALRGYLATQQGKLDEIEAGENLPEFSIVAPAVPSDDASPQLAVHHLSPAPAMSASRSSAEDDIPF